MKNSLSKKGLSMSEAQSISNTCYQKALDIANQLSTINNFSRVISIDGSEYLETKGNKMPEDIVNLILLKSRYHATQAFLMENMKAKESLISSLKSEVLVYDLPRPVMIIPEVANLTTEVGEDWGLNQLSLDEVNEFIAVEATAAHVGQFIHSKSLLDNLRKQLPTIKGIEWMEVESGKKTPVKVIVHHTPEELSNLYEEFSSIHREAEQKVNFYKAKIKNLVTAENARIAEINGVEITRVNTLNSATREEFITANTAWNASHSLAQTKFEEDRKKRILEAASLKIKTAPQFQETIDEILKTLKGDK
jgi:hypothetical protein